MIATLVRRIFFSETNRSTSVPVSPESLDREALVEPASALLREGRRDEAIAFLETLLKKHHDLVEAHLLLGKIFHVRQQLEDARDSYTLAQCFKPDWWPVYFLLGLLELDKGRPREATASLAKALELGATDARVHNALGAAHLQQDEPTEAIREFHAALNIDPTLAEAHSNLGYVLFRSMEEFEEGAKHIERALELSPGLTDALCNLCMVLQYRGKTEEALAVCDQLLQDHPDLHEARANRALILLSKGDFDSGWRDYEARKNRPSHHIGPELPWPDWDGSDPTSKTIFIYAEQGLGDEIMFASCLPQFISTARRCFVECHPKLERLFKRSFPLALIIKKDEWHKVDSLGIHSPDCKVAIGSLPSLVRRQRRDFPLHSGYLLADPRRAADWRRHLDALGGRLKVGISWRGGLASTGRSIRSIPLRLWHSILQVPHVDFVSLQYTDCEDEIMQLHNECGIEVHHWQTAIDDYDETAALVSAVDLVISVQTALVHLAGALGKPVWALIPATPEWRYGDTGPSMPWYPTARLFRQTVHGLWDPVIELAQQQLETFSLHPQQNENADG